MIGGVLVGIGVVAAVSWLAERWVWTLPAVALLLALFL